MATNAVMLVDHDQLFGAALAALLGSEDFAVDPPHPSLGRAMAEVAEGAAPDLIVMDPVGLEVKDRVEAVQRLRRAAPRAGLVVLTSDATEGAARSSLSAGADAHLSKSASLEAVRRTLWLVRLGQSVFPAAALGDEPPPQPPATESLEPDGPSRPASVDLSRREIQILSCLLAGHSNKAIARRLDITESTVKMHFKNVMRKINASNRTQAAVWAIERGIPPMP